MTTHPLFNEESFNVPGEGDEDKGDDYCEYIANHFEVLFQIVKKEGPDNNCCQSPQKGC